MEPASDIELMQGRSDYVSECLGKKIYIYIYTYIYIYIYGIMIKVWDQNSMIVFGPVKWIFITAHCVWLLFIL